jgi:hypothetical protein
MQSPSSSDRNPPQPFIRRVDRMLGEINALLVALAIGLAVLDATCFVLLKTATALEEAPQSVQTVDQTHATIQPPPGELGR